MSKHTPGPWKAIGDKIYSADQRQVAHVYALVHPNDLNVMQSIPNARLMAASAELFEILEELYNASLVMERPRLYKALAEAKKLIAKIEGDEGED